MWDLNFYNLSIRTQLLLLFLMLSLGINAQKRMIEMANPMVGTGGHGHTFPGAIYPHGMVQLSPDTRTDGWDACSGYYAEDTSILGFSHTHLSGTGVSDLSDILIMPHPARVNGNTLKEVRSKFRAGFKKGLERTRPGYYAVLFDNGVLAELTATKYVGLHRYNFLLGIKEASILVDLGFRDVVLDASMTVSGRTRLVGHRSSKSWAKDERIYFVMESNLPFDLTWVKNDKDSLSAILRYSFKDTREIILKVGISYVDTAGAINNMKVDCPNWDFDDVRKSTENAWDKELGVIEVKGGDETVKSNFYTSMYHLKTVPNLFSDADGRYRGMDANLHTDRGEETYSVFSLWDTYRSANPLYHLIDKKRSKSFIETFVKHYEQGGLLPVWELVGNETDCMIGYHSVAVIADALDKEIRGNQAEKLLEAMQKSANQDRFGIGNYVENGFVGSEKASESVSRTLEYAYDDWCIGKYAAKLGKQDIAKEYFRRAKNYQNLYDPTTGFFRAKYNNSFVKSFDPKEVNQHYTEANAWQYSLAVPHDVEGLIQLHGSVANLERHLDTLFNTQVQTTGREQADITGLIGQYAHGNEPSHHMAYFYHILGKPTKTQRILDSIVHTFYKNQPDGLIGNEDCGQMSAWYIWATLGLYPFCPGEGKYLVTRPFFETSRIHLENGKHIDIRCENPKWKGENEIFLNGKNLLGRGYITYEEISDGAEILIKPSNGGQKMQSMVNEFSNRVEGFVPVPFIKDGISSFTKSKKLEFGIAKPDLQVFYSVDKGKFNLYKKAVYLKNSAEIRAFALDAQGKTSDTIESYFRKVEHEWKLDMPKIYANHYAASGPNALIDGEMGGLDFRTGAWQGTWGKDIEFSLKIPKTHKDTRIKLRCLQDQNSWILVPEWVEVMVSEDGKKYVSLGKEFHKFSKDHLPSVIQTFEWKLPKNTKNIKFYVKNPGPMPKGHIGAGGDSWIFMDEITIGE